MQGSQHTWNLVGLGELVQGQTIFDVVDELKRNGYELGTTVRRGSNPFFAFPFGLRRTMIYEADSMDDFAAALTTFQPR